MIRYHEDSNPRSLRPHVLRTHQVAADTKRFTPAHGGRHGLAGDVTQTHNPLSHPLMKRPSRWRAGPGQVPVLPAPDGEVAFAGALALPALDVGEREKGRNPYDQTRFRVGPIAPPVTVDVGPPETADPLSMADNLACISCNRVSCWAMTRRAASSATCRATPD